MIKVLKVMILEENQADRERIKNQVLKFNPQTVFIMAKDKESFFEKMDWFLPNLVISSQEVANFHIMEAHFYVNEKNNYIPFVCLSKSITFLDPRVEVALRKANDFLFISELATLPMQLEKIIREKGDLIIQGIKREWKLVEAKIADSKLNCKDEQFGRTV